MLLKSFGCSFTYGSDLHDCTNIPNDCSHSTWPALLANSVDAGYECYAHPGIGNLQIYQTILDQVTLLDSEFFIINWTWLDRFDFIDPVQEHWHTLRPDGLTKEHQLYYKHFYHQYHTMLTNAAYISSTISILKQHNIKFIMTLLDETLFEDINPKWQLPRPTKLLENQIKPCITKFDNLNFLDWSRREGFKISDNWHPLEDAHYAAFELIKSYNLV